MPGWHSNKISRSIWPVWPKIKQEQKRRRPDGHTWQKNMLCNTVGLMEDGPGHGVGIWGKGGASLGFLDHKQEGILIWDTGAHDQALTFEIPQ